jgi:hypothetical protein
MKREIATLSLTLFPIGILASCILAQTQPENLKEQKEKMVQGVMLFYSEYIRYDED